MTATFAPPEGVYEFGPFRVDAARRRLTRDGEPVPIKARCFSLLLFLLENAGRKLSKQEILRGIWTHYVVSTANLNVNVAALRKALGESPRDHRYILTLNGYGYQFVAPVRKLPGRPDPRSETRRAEAAPPGPVHVAVLPFRILGENGDAPYLGLGLADGLITRLCRVTTLAVRSTGAVRRYAEEETPIREVAGDLRVGVLVDGTVRRHGNRLSVRVQLVEPGGGSVRWSELYESDVNDLASLEGRIASELVQVLLPEGGGKVPEVLATNRPRNPEAHRLFMQGRYLFTHYDPAGLQAALEYFDRALQLEPDFPPALASRALALHGLNWFGMMPSDPALVRAEEDARRALAMDPTSSRALMVLGLIRATYHHRFEEGEDTLRQALRHAPHDGFANFYMAHLLNALGRFDEAYAHALRAVEGEPTSSLMSTLLGQCQYFRGDHETAHHCFQMTLRADPDHLLARFQSGWNALRLPDPELAISEWRRLEAGIGETPWTHSLMALALGRAGRTAEARERLGQLEKAAAEMPVSPIYRAMAHLGLGERDRVLDALEEAVDSRVTYMCWVGRDPAWTELRGNPRFARILERIRGGD